MAKLNYTIVNFKFLFNINRSLRYLTLQMKIFSKVETKALFVSAKTKEKFLSAKSKVLPL